MSQTFQAITDETNDEENKRTVYYVTVLIHKFIKNIETTDLCDYDVDLSTKKIIISMKKQKYYEIRDCLLRGDVYKMALHSENAGHIPFLDDVSHCLYYIDNNGNDGLLRVDTLAYYIASIKKWTA